jgi:hypothetical protein
LRLVKKNNEKEGSRRYENPNKLYVGWW